MRASHVAEAGPGEGPAYLFVHGWPESWRTWLDVMTLAGRTNRAVAIDLPGIGGSQRGAGTGTKAAIARVLRGVTGALGLEDLTLVGHDIGGMVVYSYLRQFADLPRAVIMDVPVPGVAPWDDFVREPFLWHFALHAVDALPELLTAGKQAAYFGYFYDLLSAHPGIPSADCRAEQASAYATPAALSAGFDWYRAFAADAQDNLAAAGRPRGDPAAVPARQSGAGRRRRPVRRRLHARRAHPRRGRHHRGLGALPPGGSPGADVGRHQRLRQPSRLRPARVSPGLPPR